MLADVLKTMPIVAILRGIESGEAEEIGGVLYASGVRCIEVPLNSPKPFASIRILADSLPDDCLVGAGTVLSAENVRKVRDAGGKLIVTPNVFEDVIRTALEQELDVAPGFASPTEAFHAIRLGVKTLKLFPASTYGSNHLRALLAVLPIDVRVLVVGGIGAKDFVEWRDAGAMGFGIGSELYTAGDTWVDVENKLVTMRAVLE